jgi:Holliday junction resolvase RusA-like endonuclease
MKISMKREKSIFQNFFLKFTNIQKDIDSNWKLLLDAATLLDHTDDHKFWESQKNRGCKNVYSK